MGDSVPLLELHRLELEEAARGEALAELEAQLLSTDRNSSHVLGEPTLPASILAGPRLSSSRSANRDAASSVGSSSFAPAGRQSGQLGSARGSSTNPADLPGGDATQASSAHVKRLAAAPPSPSAWGGGQDAGTLDSKVTASNEERPVYTPVTEFRKVMTPPGDGDSGGNELLVSRGSSVQFDSSPRLGLAAHAKQPSRVQLLPPRSPLDNEAVVFEISDENSREAAGLYRPPLSRVIYGDLLAEPVVVGGSAEVLTTLDDLPGTPSSYHGAGKSSTVFSTPSAAETARKPIERGGNDAGQDFEFEASGHQPQKAREDVGVEWRSEMPEADEKQRRRQVARERWTKVRDTLNLNADQLAGADAPSSRHESTVRHHMTNSGPKRVLLSAVKPSDFDGGDAEGLDKAYRVYAYDSNVRSEKGMSRLESMRTRGGLAKPQILIWIQ